MIFVATGMHFRGFDRLVKKVDDLISQGIIIDNVFMQIGYSKYEPEHAAFKKSVTFEEFEKYINESDIIITHGGAGCITDGLERGKPVIVVPRQAKYNEHSDDHQRELTAQLEKEARIIAVYDLDDLNKAILRAQSFNPALSKAKCRIPQIISDYLQKI